MLTDLQHDEAEARVRESQASLKQAVGPLGKSHGTRPSTLVRSTSLERFIIAVGVTCLALIGLLGALVAALAIASNLISGFEVANWFTDTSPFDQLGGGTPGSGVRYVIFAVGAVVASVSKAGIDYLRDASKN